MKIAIIGAGAMGGSLAKGLLKSGRWQAGNITVANRTEAALRPFAELGAHTTTDNVAAATGADVVFVVVKPWVVEGVLAEIKGSLDISAQTVVVIAAGVGSADMARWLADSGGRTPAPMLAMPNIAVAELCSMTFVVPVKATRQQTESVCAVLDSVGRTLITEERLLPAATTLASCGIAYAMRYVRAATEGGVELGFKAQAARDIVLQTVRGAVELLQVSGDHPEAAIDTVTTPGGVTIRGLNEMEHAGFSSAVIRGLKAGLQ